MRNVDKLNQQREHQRLAIYARYRQTAESKRDEHSRSCTWHELALRRAIQNIPYLHATEYESEIEWTRDGEPIWMWFDIKVAIAFSLQQKKSITAYVDLLPSTATKMTKSKREFAEIAPVCFIKSTKDFDGQLTIWLLRLRKEHEA